MEMPTMNKTVDSLMVVGMGEGLDFYPGKWKITNDQSGSEFGLVGANDKVIREIKPHRYTREDNAWYVIDGELSTFGNGDANRWARLSKIDENTSEQVRIGYGKCEKMIFSRRSSPMMDLVAIPKNGLILFAGLVWCVAGAMVSKIGLPLLWNLGSTQLILYP